MRLAIRTAFVLMCVLLQGCYDPSRFRGDGAVVKLDPTRQLEYVMTLGEFPLNRNGTYEFTFSGAPPGDAITGLASRDLRLTDAMGRTGVELTLEVFDGSGRSLGVFGGDRDHEWRWWQYWARDTGIDQTVYQTHHRRSREDYSPGSEPFYCDHLRFYSGTYRVRVVVDGVSETEPPIVARPLFVTLKPIIVWP